MSPRRRPRFRLAAEVPGERQPASFWLMLSDEHRDRMFQQLSGRWTFRQQRFDFSRGEQSRKFFARPQGQRHIARVVRAPMLEDVDDIARLEAVRAIEGYEFYARY